MSVSSVHLLCVKVTLAEIYRQKMYEAQLTQNQLSPYWQTKIWVTKMVSALLKIPVDYTWKPSMFTQKLTLWMNSKIVWGMFLPTLIIFVIAFGATRGAVNASLISHLYLWNNLILQDLNPDRVSYRMWDSFQSFQQNSYWTNLQIRVNKQVWHWGQKKWGAIHKHVSIMPSSSITLTILYSHSFMSSLFKRHRK